MKRIKVVLILMIILGIFIIYLGYNLEKKDNLKKNDTLYSRVLLSKKISKDKDGYYYKGNVHDNYIKIYNRIYRILDASDKNIKIVSNTNEAVFYYGSNTSYKESNIYKFLNKSEVPNTGVYFNSITTSDKYLNYINYSINNYDNDNLTKITMEKDFFTILGVDDYIKSGGKGSFLDNGTSSFLLGYSNNKPLYKNRFGKIKEINMSEASGVRVVMNIDSNIKVSSGDGTVSKPFILKSDFTNNINKYVKLGDDLYNIINEDDNYYKLRLNTYLKNKKNFSNGLSGFNPINKNNIAYFLNNEYYDSLSYKDYLSFCTFYTGEIDSKNYSDNFSSTSTVKVGLINMFDLNIEDFLTNYYLINTSRSDKDISYVYSKFGEIEEEKSTTTRKIIPVICIKKNLVNNGDGSVKNPFIVE